MIDIKIFDWFIEIHAGKMDFIKYLKFEDRELMIKDAFETARSGGIEFNPGDPLAAMYPDNHPVFDNVYTNDVDYFYGELSKHGYIIEHSDNNNVLSCGLTNAPAFAYNGKVYAFMQYDRGFMTDLIYRYGYVRLEFVRNFDRNDLQNICDYLGLDIDEELANGVITIEQPLPCADLPFAI